MLAVGYGMVFIYALRGAGMYALTTTTLLRESRNHAHLAGSGELSAGALPAADARRLHPVAVLIFPAWVVIAGLVVFIRAGRVAEPAASERQSA